MLPDDPAAVSERLLLQDPLSVNIILHEATALTTIKAVTILTGITTSFSPLRN